MSKIEWHTFITDSKLPTRVQRALLSHGFIKISDLRNLSKIKFRQWPGIGAKGMRDLEDFMWENFKYEIPFESELYENSEYLARLELSLQDAIIYEDQLDQIMNMFRKRIFPRPY